MIDVVAAAPGMEAAGEISTKAFDQLPFHIKEVIFHFAGIGKRTHIELIFNFKQGF